MAFLKNAWYVAMWGEDLGTEPVRRRILGEPIVLFRTVEGRVIALADACPHRFAPLSMGRVTEQGAIRCAYHGLEFDHSGRCIFNPHGAGRIPPAANVRSYTIEERHFAIWVWMGSGPGDPNEIPDFSHLDEADPEHITKRDWLEMKADYRLITDNLLDLSHTSYLHDGILGSAETTKADVIVEQEGTRLTVRRWMPNVPIPQLVALMHKPADGRYGDLWMDIRWDKPGCFKNFNGATDPGRPREEGSGMIGNHFLTPIDANTTAYHFCAIRWNPRHWGPEVDADIRQQLAELRRFAFEFQDQPVIDAQQRNLDDPAVDTSRPALFDIDIGPVRFSRILDELIEQECDAAS